VFWSADGRDSVAICQIQSPEPCEEKVPLGGLKGLLRISEPVAFVEKEIGGVHICADTRVEDMRVKMKRERLRGAFCCIMIFRESEWGLIHRLRALCGSLRGIEVLRKGFGGMRAGLHLTIRFGLVCCTG